MGNALVVFGPILGNPLHVSQEAFYRFYDHTDAHFLYESNLESLGRRPIGFPRQPAAAPPRLRRREAPRRRAEPAPRDAGRIRGGGRVRPSCRTKRAYRDTAPRTGALPELEPACMPPAWSCAASAARSPGTRGGASIGHGRTSSRRRLRSLLERSRPSGRGPRRRSSRPRPGREGARRRRSAPWRRSSPPRGPPSCRPSADLTQAMAETAAGSRRPRPGREGKAPRAGSLERRRRGITCQSG